MYNFAKLYFIFPLFTVLFALAMLALIFPEKAVEFRVRKPAAYIIILVLSGLIQFPILVSGFWEIGIAFSRINRGSVFDLSLGLLPMLYFAMFILSIVSQRKPLQSNVEGTSFTLAVYTGFVMGPFIYLSAMSVVYYFLRT